MWQVWARVAALILLTSLPSYKRREALLCLMFCWRGRAVGGFGTSWRDGYLGSLQMVAHCDRSQPTALHTPLCLSWASCHQECLYLLDLEHSFFMFQSKPYFCSFLKSPALMNLLHLFSILFVRNSQGHSWPSQIIVWVNYPSADLQGAMFCRFLAEPAFIMMRLHVLYIRRKHYSCHSKYHGQGF